MNKLNFSYNWNNKLGCKCFTTIRIQNTKYKIGSIHEVFHKKERLGIAEVVALRELRIRDLNEFVCRIDTGYSLEETKKILRRMYKNADRELYNFVLLAWKDKG